MNISIELEGQQRHYTLPWVEKTLPLARPISRAIAKVLAIVGILATALAASIPATAIDSPILDSFALQLGVLAIVMTVTIVVAFIAIRWLWSVVRS